MEVPCHTSTFRQSLIESGADGSRNPQHTQSVDNPHDEDNGENAENSEPVRLIPGRRDAEVQGCTGVVPDAIVITRDHAKPIIPRRQVCVVSLASAHGAVPVIVVALKLVAELNLFWGRQAEGCVFKLQILGSWPERLIAFRQARESLHHLPRFPTLSFPATRFSW